jgi:hypothetical protein
MVTLYTYFSLLSDECHGLIDLSSNVKCLLVDTTFVLDRINHSRLSDIQGEVAGTGYTEGGNDVTVTFTPLVEEYLQPKVIELRIAFQPVFFNISTFETKGAIYYINKDSRFDSILLAYLDFGNTLSFYGNNLEIQEQVLTKTIL